MSNKTNIEWTEKTWNPVTGCDKVTAGCKNCYAESMAHRLQAMGTRGYENGFKVSLLPERLDQPLKNTMKPSMYFVCSMSDLFHEEVPFHFIDQVFDVIREARRLGHTFQVLTKRPERMAEYFSLRKVPGNVWIATTVENQKQGVPRIDILRGIKTGGVRFLSVEPLLESLGELDLSGIHQVIVGGESGTNARSMKKEWVEDIRNQCKRQGVAFFFKQWGAFGEDGIKRSKKANGSLLDNVEYKEVPKTGALLCQEKNMYEDIEDENIRKTLSDISELVPAIYDDVDGWIINAKVTWHNDDYKPIEPIFISIDNEGERPELCAQFRTSDVNQVQVNIDVEPTKGGYIVTPIGVAVGLQVGLVSGYRYEGLHVQKALNEDVILYKNSFTETLSNDEETCYVTRFREDDDEPPFYCFAKDSIIIFEASSRDEAISYSRKNRLSRLIQEKIWKYFNSVIQIQNEVKKWN